MHNLSTIKPTTITGIKRLAKQIKKSEGVKHQHSLNKAVQQAGFGNYRHALKNLATETELDDNARYNVQI